MTPSVNELLIAFDALSDADQRKVAAEILRRTRGADELPEAGLQELADELFRRYDAEEAARAAS